MSRGALINEESAGWGRASLVRALVVVVGVCLAVVAVAANVVDVGLLRLLCHTVQTKIAQIRPNNPSVTLPLGHVLSHP